MGAILAGIIQGMGQHAAEQNTINMAAKNKANEEMAQMFDKAAVEQGRNPEDQFRLHQMAYLARTKGTKAILPAQLKYYQDQIAQGVRQQKDIQNRQQQNQSQQVQQAMPTVQQGVTGQPGSQPNSPPASLPAPQGMSPPDYPDLGQGGPGPGGPPPNPTNAAAPVAAAVTADQQEAASPSPKGNAAGLSPPSPGFSGIAPPSDNGAWVTPPRRNRFQSPIVDTGGAPLNLRGPEEQQEFAARGAGLTAGAQAESRLPSEISLKQAQYQAEAAGKIAEFNARWKLANDFIKNLTSQQGTNSDVHWSIRVANGMPEPVEDNGTPLPRVYIGSQLPARAKIEGGLPADPKGTYTLIRYKDGALTATPVATPLSPGQTTEGNVTQYNRYIPGSAQEAGAVAPSLAAPKPVTDAHGNVSYESVGQMAAGAPPVPSGGINPGMAPTTSTQTTPGQLPQTTTRVKGLPASTSSAPRSGAVQNDNSVIANNYKDWMAGKATLSDKEQTAARQYAASHGLPTPEILSGPGQHAVATIQPILEEVQRAKKMVEDMGLDKMSAFESKAALAKAYGKYAYLKTDDPLAKVISDLSFDSLRSVGQALQGTGSRAYPIFNRALEHTPVIGLNSDDGALIHSKLTEMETRLKASLDAAYTETKSGIVPQGIPAPGVTPPPAARPSNAEEYLRSIQGR